MNRYMRDFVTTTEELLGSDTVRSMGQWKHHGPITTLDHSLFVAYLSYRWARFLHLDARAAARGGLLHDLYLYDSKDKSAHPGWQCFDHPRTAAKNAQALTDLSPKEKNIILSHMWPLGGALPRSPEAWLVDLVDTICAGLEVFRIYHPAKLRRRTLEQLAQYIACGLDPVRSVIFIQSHVPQHAELAWVLGCYTQFGELSRMTQFKDKSKKHADNITAGLFTYPVLMAADILVYQADLVPVGQDQKQHVELCRDIAQRFNGVYGDTFTLPEPFIPKMGARVMSLGDPTSKMSKSDPDGCVYMMDKPEDIMRKFKRAVTDCDACVKFDKENKPGISNLLSIYCAATGKTVAEAEAAFAGQGYGIFKPAVAESVIELLRPIREEAERLTADKAYLESVYKDGAQKASYLAEKTLRKVYKKVGFVAR